MLVTFLMIVLGLVTVLLGFVILIQEPKQAGLSGAFGGGMGGSDQMMGTKATSGIGRFTAILSVTFFSLCILVGVASSSDRDSSRLQSDTVEPGFGAIDGTEDSVGVGDAIGDAIGDDTPTVNDGNSDGSTEGAIGADERAADTPADDAPADDAPADDTPADDTPADDAPADDAPADDAPATDAPADQPTGDDGSGN
jgi:protein translocase SecG subunit